MAHDSEAFTVTECERSYSEWREWDDPTPQLPGIGTEWRVSVLGRSEVRTQSVRWPRTMRAATRGRSPRRIGASAPYGDVETPDAHDHGSGLLDTYCWCGAQIKRVPFDLVQRGETLPCQSARCRVIVHRRRTDRLADYTTPMTPNFPTDNYSDLKD